MCDSYCMCSVIIMYVLFCCFCMCFQGFVNNFKFPTIKLLF